MSDRPSPDMTTATRTAGTPTREVYLYDASSERLVCASCNPTGARPTGVLDTQESGEGLGVLVDRPHTWDVKGTDPGWPGASRGGQRRASSSRSTSPAAPSDSGRLLFDSADALSPQVKARTRAEGVNGKEAQVGVENVYRTSARSRQLHELSRHVQRSVERLRGPYLLRDPPHESAFLDAGVSGNDVFFITAKAPAAGHRNPHSPLRYARLRSGVAVRAPAEYPGLAVRRRSVPGGFPARTDVRAAGSATSPGSATSSRTRAGARHQGSRQAQAADAGAEAPKP